jgi:hypothetical protein
LHSPAMNLAALFPDLGEPVALFVRQQRPGGVDESQAAPRVACHRLDRAALPLRVGASSFLPDRSSRSAGQSETVSPCDNPVHRTNEDRASAPSATRPAA